MNIQSEFNPKYIFNGRLIIDHLPKTAGSALNTWFKLNFGQDSIFDSFIGRHDDLIDKYGGRYPIISGHLDFNGEGMSPFYQYITCIRHPLDRSLSWLYFVLNNTNKSLLTDGLWDAVKTFFDTECDVVDEILFDNICNPCVHHFAFVTSLRPRTPEEKLEDALSALHLYDVWGLYEQMDEFMHDVGTFLGVDNPTTLPRVNVTENRPKSRKLSKKIEEKLLELNDLDIRFYNTLKDEYAKRIKKPMRQKHKFLSYSKAEISFLQLAGTARVYHGTSHLLLNLKMINSSDIDNLRINVNIFDKQGNCLQQANNFSDGAGSRVLSGYNHLEIILAHELKASEYGVGLSLMVEEPKGWREIFIENHVTSIQITTDHISNDKQDSSTSFFQPNLVEHHLEAKIVNDVLGSINCQNAPNEIKTNEKINLSISLENRSSEIWVSSPIFPINLAYHWLDQHGSVYEFDGFRSPLPTTHVYPLSSIDAEMLILAPTTAGDYTLVLSPVQEGRGWFDGLNFKTQPIKIRVNK